ncbi:hypothetical protein BGP77_00695 [Saccharospirillum sp. MSK14-1]|uniref:hypothetical protein n=1 Tax=Saccharospirillum sp. MSK14-1 TaxID=1897632 RepID=UPI000D33D890|nr:hypothetical protein [Saccharospirillum sp. MSK14-1]PTY35879.1 hypothetical protein BGP77_00695 [Saccharospirillum sp. MSK14-1]
MTIANTASRDWSLVILRVSQTSAQIWVGTLHPDLHKPEKAYVEVTGPNGTFPAQEIHLKEWKRPFRYVNKRFYHIVEFTGLEPGVQYQVSFSRQPQAIYREYTQKQLLKSGQFKTLPAQLPTDSNQPFTIAFGSCYYDDRDGGQAAGAYRALYTRGHSSVQPDISFLTGDQVYLDIGIDSLSPVTSEIRDRVAGDYYRHWDLLSDVFTHGATWMLPDDHEFWNDYPFYDTINPYLLAIRIDYIRNTWKKAALDGVKKVQATQRIETFDVGELSFCLADVRTERDEHGFLPQAEFEKLDRWARKLTGPGVLVMSQPLLVKPEAERNLLSYTDQYTALLEALGSSGHTIVMLSGDVHFGRVATATLGPKKGKLIELISSPMSNLTHISSSLANETPESEPVEFPHPSINIPGWTRQSIEPNSNQTVSTRKGWPLSAYWTDRTTEHFMTASFNKDDNGEIKLVVNAWRVRQRDDDNLPVRDLGPFEFRL